MILMLVICIDWILLSGAVWIDQQFRNWVSNDKNVDFIQFEQLIIKKIPF